MIRGVSQPDAPPRMPPGVLVFLGYAFLVLGAIGLSLRTVVDQAIAAPVSPVGVVVMVLLAYTIFTTTLVLQRKQAARGLALGLVSLLAPAAVVAGVAGFWPVALLLAALGGVLWVGLTRPDVAAWLREP